MLTGRNSIIIFTNLVASLLVLIVIIFTNQFVGQSFFKVLKITNFQNMYIVYGFQIITIVFSIIYVFNIDQIDMYKYNIVLLVLIFLIITYQKIRHKIIVNLNFDYRLLSLLVIIAIFLMSGVIELRFHSSPDNHGLLATVSYISQHPSFQYLQNNFMEETGSLIPAHLGQKTSIMDSTWNILDARLRFTADTMLTVGRIGLPVYLSSFISSNINLHLLYLIIIFGIYLSWMIWLCLLGISKFYDGKNRDLNIFLIFLVLTPLNIVWIVEGTINQLCLLLAIASMINIQTKIYAMHQRMSFIKTTFISIIPVLFMTVTYPQGLPILIIIMTAFHFWLLKLATAVKTFHIILIASISSLPIMLFTVRHTLFTMVLSFGSGVAGIPYQLGSLGLFKSSLWIANGVKFTKYTAPVDGFGNIIVEYSVPMLEILILSAFSIYILLRSKNAKISSKLASIILVIVITLLPIRSMISESSNNTYIYIRYLVLYLVVMIGILIRIADLQLSGVKIIRSKGFIVAISTLTIIQVYFAQQNLIEFKTNSNKIIVGDLDLDRKIFNANSLFLSDEPMHKYFSLSLFGEFNYLTDNWNPQISVNEDSRQFKVYKIEDSGEEVVIEFKGLYNFENTIKGPKTLGEIEQYKVTKN